MSTMTKASNTDPDGTRRPLHVLLVEDSQPDAILISHALQAGGFAPTCERVDTAEAMMAALARGPWDLILADHAMPHFSAPEALELLKRAGADVPFIIVSGHIDEETAVAAMRAGAHDYIMKGRLARLVPAVERELREAEVRRARDKSEEELRRAHEELEARVERRTAALKEANRQLENVIEERKRLENELLEIAENERRRIGFDLHDDLGQKLTGVSMMIKGLEQRLNLENHPCTSDAHRIHLLVNELIHHTHDLAHEFGSLDVRGDDLPTVLKGLSDNVHKLFQIPCPLTVKGTMPTLPQHSTVQLYKIAQEAVSNAIKHGKATKVAVTLTRRPDKLTLTIKNDGIPFAPEKANKNRMGLRIMNYRASTIGGRMDIQPVDKSGTIVTCELPLLASSSTSHHSHEGSGKTSPAHPNGIASGHSEVASHAQAE
jgi:signal transduction histidine kinase